MQAFQRRFVSLSYKYKNFMWTKVEDLNPCMVKAQYAVRGLVPSKAAEIQAELHRMVSEGIKNEKYPFDSITELNIGNPQTYGQKPISFNRDVLSCLINPSLLDNKAINRDAINRAKFYMNSIGFSIGAYSQSLGYPVIREAVAKFIQNRDRSPTKPNISDIILTDGASQGINLLLSLFIKDSTDGVMLPIPQYPLYSAVIAQLGVNIQFVYSFEAHEIPYYLEEEKGWTVTFEHLQNQYNDAITKGIKPRCLVVINPGNPTGQVYDRKTIETLIKFAYNKKLILFADEVYQENVYAANKQFFSFKKVMEELTEPYNQTEIYSFHSISKGISGECGFRGGYCQISNVDPEVHFEIQKTKSILLCSNTVGQILTGLMVTPPSKEEGCSDQTIEQYQSECKALFDSLKKRAEIVTDSLNRTKGVSCQPVEGAMYAFPTVKFSNKYIEHAKSQGFSNPDVLYCLDMLSDTGLVVVPGSGFHQYPGTHHFRMTTLILPEERLLEKMKVYQKWHEAYMAHF